MKYTLISKQISADTPVFDVEEIPEERDELGRLVEEAYTIAHPTSRIFVSILLTISVEAAIPDPEIKFPNITKNLIVESEKSLTVNEIQAQRQKAIDDYMKTLK